MTTTSVDNQLHFLELFMETTNTIRKAVSFKLKDKPITWSIITAEFDLFMYTPKEDQVPNDASNCQPYFDFKAEHYPALIEKLRASGFMDKMYEAIADNAMEEVKHGEGESS